MKKQFFYAAFAIAMMASCTSENDVLVEQPATPDDDKVAIELGVDSPTITASAKSVSRGTGSVGDVEGANNIWNGQTLYVTMIDRETGEVATDENGKVVLGHESQIYKAPGADQNTPNGLITFYNKTTTTQTDYVYYPVSGQYDFYGWHLDDATDATVDATASNNKPNISITGITIDGTQDIMGAKTKDPSADDNWSNLLSGWEFSARTARAGVKPTLKFEHKLARLKFFVRAGSHKTALTGETGTKNEVILDDQLTTITSDGTGTTYSTAMFIDSLGVKNLHSKFDMTLNEEGIATSNPSGQTNFTLGSKVTVATAGYEVGEIGTLEATAPEKLYEAGDESSKGTQVGESIIFLPVESSTADEIDLEIRLKQLIKKYTNNGLDTYAYEERTAPLTVKASSIVGGDAKFEAGHSYNIYITIYGFEQIEVSAELTAWEVGGDVDVDIEEGVSKHDVDVEFTVTADDNSAITPTYQYWLVGADNAETELTEQTTNKVTVKSYSTIKYQISAEGCESATGYVNAEKGKTVSIVLTKKPVVTYTVNITAPDNAEIWIDNENKSSVEVQEGGSVTYTIKLAGYQDYTATESNITEGKTIQVRIEEMTKLIKITGKAVAARGADAISGATVTLTATGYTADTDGSITVPVGTQVSWTVENEGVTYEGIIDTSGKTGDEEVELVCDDNTKKEG